MLKVGELVGVTVTLLITGFIVIQIATFIRVGQASIRSSGELIAPAGLGVYQDQNCTQELTEINWGSLEPGETRDRWLYIRNEGIRSISLNTTTENYSPENAINYMIFSWDREQYRISPDEVILVTLTLYVSEEISGITSFSFDIIINYEQ
jgi:hypothetical protein